MRVRCLKIRVDTSQGLYGADIDFPNGLVILRASNSMGKSTCIKAIMVALGLEAMVTTSQRELPLPAVLTQELIDHDEEIAVNESNVYLEIENLNADRIVVHRTIKGLRNKDLITVTYGPALTQPDDDYNSEEFFLSRQGSASRERGFHYFLSRFLGWDLPLVPTYAGNRYPLYLQCIFPFVFVEQTRGWSSLSPAIPTHFRIKDVHQRVVEFLLDLEAYRIASQKDEIDRCIVELERLWSDQRSDLRSQARNINGRVSNVPKHPVSSWPPEIEPAIVIPYEEEWVPIGTLMEKHRGELANLIEHEIPRVQDISMSAEEELRSAEIHVREKQALLARIYEALANERAELGATEKHLAQIEEDLKRNKDVRTLIGLGAEIAPHIAAQQCPTCHQSVKDTLIADEISSDVMSIDENITFLEDQKTTYRAVLGAAKTALEARETQASQLRSEIASIRAQIRSIRSTLVSDGRLPSAEAIRKRIELENTLRAEERTLEEFEIIKERFGDLSVQYKSLIEEKNNLPKDNISTNDRAKIQAWTESLKEQLGQYNFRSLNIETISVSEDSYRPIHEGFDLPSNISASDFIRVIWSFLTGLLEVSREFKTHHPGILIFDEPKQQSTEDLSFEELLRRVAKAGEYNQQVVFATSEEEDSLRGMLDGVEHTYIAFEERIIAKLR